LSTRSWSGAPSPAGSETAPSPSCHPPLVIPRQGHSFVGLPPVLALHFVSRVIYTIGHSTRELADFLGLLAAHRSPSGGRAPLSGVAPPPTIRREALATALEQTGVRYQHEPDLAGVGRPVGTRQHGVAQRRFRATPTTWRRRNSRCLGAAARARAGRPTRSCAPKPCRGLPPPADRDALAARGKRWGIS